MNDETRTDDPRRRALEVRLPDGRTAHVDVRILSGSGLDSEVEPPWSEIIPVIEEVFSVLDPENEPERWGQFRHEVEDAVAVALSDKELDLEVGLGSGVERGTIEHGGLELEVSGLEGPLHLRSAKTQHDPDRLPVVRPTDLRAEELRRIREAVEQRGPSLSRGARERSDQLSTILLPAINERLAELGRKLTSLDLRAFEWELDARRSTQPVEVEEPFDRYAKELRQEVLVRVPFGIEEVSFEGLAELSLGSAVGWEYRTPRQAREGLEAELRVALSAALRGVCWSDMERRPERVRSRVTSRLRDLLAPRGYRVEQLFGTLEASNAPPATLSVCERVELRVERRPVEVEIEIDAELVSSIEWRESQTSDLEGTIRTLAREKARRVLARAELTQVLQIIDAGPGGASGPEAQLRVLLAEHGQRLGYRFECRLHVVEPRLVHLVEGFQERLYFSLPTRWAEHEAEFIAHVSGRCAVNESRSLVLQAARRGREVDEWLHQELGRYLAARVRSYDARQFYAVLDGGVDSGLVRDAQAWLTRAGVADATVELEFAAHPRIDEFRRAWGGFEHSFEFELGSRLHHHSYEFRAALQLRGLAQTGIGRFFRVSEVPGPEVVERSVSSLLKEELRAREDGEYLREDRVDGDFEPLLRELDAAVREHCLDVHGLEVKLTQLERKSSVEETVASARRREALDAEHDRVEHRQLRRRGASSGRELAAEQSAVSVRSCMTAVVVEAPLAGYRSATPGCVFRPTARVVVSHDHADPAQELIKSLTRRTLRQQLAGVTAEAFWLAPEGAAQIEERHRGICEQIEHAIFGQVEGVRAESVELEFSGRMAERLESWLGTHVVLLEDLTMEHGEFVTEAEARFEIEGVRPDGWAAFSRDGGNDAMDDLVDDFVRSRLWRERGEFLVAAELPRALALDLSAELASRFGVEGVLRGVTYSRAGRRTLMNELKRIKEQRAKVEKGESFKQEELDEQFEDTNRRLGGTK